MAEIKKHLYVKKRGEFYFTSVNFLYEKYVNYVIIVGSSLMLM